MALIDRRTFLAGAAGLSAAGLLPTSLRAADFPSASENLSWLIYQAPGGSVDLSTRTIQPWIEKAGFTVRLEYAQGGGGRVARTKLFSAKPDGYTIMTEVAPAAVVDEALFNVPYKAADFQPIFGWILNGFQYCVKKDSPIRTFSDFVAETKKRRVTMATIGRGGAFHMHVAGMRKELGLDFDIVHFDGSSPAYTAVIGGHIDVGGGGPGSGVRQADSLHFIGTSGTEREKALPDVPTIIEQGFKVTPVQQAYFATTTPGVPAERLAVLTKAFEQAFNDPELVKKMEASGDYLTLLSPTQLKALNEQQKVLFLAVKDELKK